MNGLAKVALFGVALILMFLAAFGLGRAAGPIDTTGERGIATTMTAPPTTPQHGQGHR